MPDRQHSENQCNGLCLTEVFDLPEYIKGIVLHTIFGFDYWVRDLKSAQIIGMETENPSERRINCEKSAEGAVQLLLLLLLERINTVSDVISLS